MPCDENRGITVKTQVAAFYQKNTLDAVTFGYFTAKVRAGSTMKEAAILMQDDFGWSEDDYSIDQMVHIYKRMRGLSFGLKLTE